MANSYYFSHDCNARNDDKILMLRYHHGWEGYGIYWALIEMMFEINETSLHHDKIIGIATNYNIDITLLQKVINTCIEEKLFESNGTIFWSNSLRRRKTKYFESIEKRSMAGRKGMASRWGSDNNVITNNNKERKEKKEKEKEKKESKYSDESNEMSLAYHMASKIKEISPSTKLPKKEQHWQQWASIFDKIIRIDERPIDDIYKLITFVYKDPFWQSTILSPSGLRKNYDKVYIKMKKHKPKQETGLSSKYKLLD